MDATMIWFKEFVSKQNIFSGKTIEFPDNFDPTEYHFISGLQKLEGRIKARFDTERESLEKDDSEVNNEWLLILCVIEETYDFIVSSNDEYSFLGKNSIFELFSNVLFGENEEENPLDFTLYNQILDVCLFNTLCSFINSTKRKKRLSIKRAMEKHYRVSTDVDDKAFPENEAANIRKMKERLFSERGSYNKSIEWSAISLDLGHELATIYDLRFYDVLKDYYPDRKLPDEKLARVFKRIGNLNKEIIKALSRPNCSQEFFNYALMKFSSKVKKIMYTEYLELGKYILSKICEDKEYYGINLYRFEKHIRLYWTINNVNLLSYCPDKETERIITNNILFLRDIPFPNLNQSFCKIRDPLFCSQSLKAFLAIRERVILASCLILDKLVEDGHLGDGDEWYHLFLDIINDMAEDVLYDPEKIDYSTTPESQAKFEQVLSAPNIILKEMASMASNQNRDSP